MSADANNPCVISFGYDGTSSIDMALTQDERVKTSDSKLANFNFDKNHIIYLGGFSYLEKSKNAYCDIYSAKKLDSDYTQLKSSYDAYRSQARDNTSISQYNNIKKYGVTYNLNRNAESKNIESVGNFANVSSPSSSGSLVHMSTMRKFTFGNLEAEHINVSPYECGPVAGMNIAYYWRQYRGIHLTEDGNDQATFWWLEEDMGTATHGVPDMNDFVLGLVKFGQRNGYNPKGTASVNYPSESWVKTNISNENIFGFGVKNDPTYRNHMMTCTGWGYNGSTFYLRLLDGKVESSVWYKLSSGVPTEAGYVRW